MGKFVVYKSDSGYRFVLKANNGETIATSEIYTSKSACMNGIESIQSNAPIAKVDDLTLDSDEKEPNPKFELYKDKAGEYRFRLKARNGQIIAASEGYTAKSGCKNGIESVRKNAPDALVVEQ